MSAEEFLKQHGLYNQYLIWKDQNPEDRSKFSNWYLNVYKKNHLIDSNLPDPEDFKDSHQYDLALARKAMKLRRLNKKIFLDIN